jgi:polyisoprenyl-phosphate glycosyltransferase
VASSDTVTFSVVAPFYDDAANVEDFVAAVVRALRPLGEPYELVLVDDGSSDGTWEAILACQPAHETGMIRGIRLSRNFGKEAALCAGVEQARGAAVITMDGDLQHPPELIPTLVQAWRGGAEVVDGVKVARADQSFVGRGISRTFNWLFTRLSGVPLDEASDFKLLDRKAVDAWADLPERNLFFRGTTTWIGFERAQVEFEVQARATGRSGWSLGGLLRLATNAVTGFSTKPLHLMTAGGFAFVVASAILLVQTFVRYLQGEAAEGFTTVIMLLLLQGGAIMLGLGIIGEYLARIHEEVKGRPRYLVRDRTDG